MKEAVFIAVIVVAAAVGIIFTVRHFTGRGGCCGGGGYRQRRKRLKNVKYQKTFAVGGMHCKNCKVRVEETVNDIKGVVGCADLKSGILTVRYAEDVSDELILTRVTKAGYHITPLK